MKFRDVSTIFSSVIAVLLWFSAVQAEAGANIWTTHGPAGPVQLLASPPEDPRTIYAGGTANFDIGLSLFKTEDGGLSWERLPLGDLHATMLTCLAVDPTRPGSVYAGVSSPSYPFSRQFLISRDGGSRWTTQAFDDWPDSIAVDPKTGEIYVGGGSVLKSADGGHTWTRPTSNSQHASYALLADSLKETLLEGSNWDFVETQLGLYPWGGTVARSVDGGSNWSFSSVNLGSPVVSLAKNARSTAYYAGTDAGALYRSVDGGSDWQLLATLPGRIAALAVDPTNSSFLYAATPNRGVLRSTNGGASWWPFNPGMSSQYVTSLTIDSTGRVLHAGTDQGVFDYQILPGALDVSVGPDKTARILFTDLHERLVVRRMNRSGDIVTQTYGPYSDWSPTALADGPDGVTRVLWNHRDGSAALWLVGSDGSNGASYRLGPVEGWTAVDVATGAPGITHVLWTHEDGRVGFWAVDNSGHVSYGPKLASDPGWTAAAISGGDHGWTRLLWNNDDGSTRLSLVGMGGVVASYDYAASAGWLAVDVAAGADGQSRILRTNADGRMSLDRVDDSGNVTVRGPVYEAPIGFTARRLGAGPDGSTRVLWTDLEGSALLWLMSADNVYLQSFRIGSNCGSVEFGLAAARTSERMSPDRCLSSTPDGQH